MSKRITVQDGNLEFDIVTGAISFPSETRDLDFVGESGTIATFHDVIITTDAATLQITEAGTWDTITRTGGASDFLAEGFYSGQVITIGGSGTTNDGVYEIANDGVTALVITVEWFYDLVDEGPSGSLTLTGSDKYFELSEDSKLKLTSWEDPTLYGTFETTGGGHLQIRMSDPDPLGGSIFAYGGGHIGVLDNLNTVSNPPADTDVAESTVGGWSEAANMDMLVSNFVPGSALGGWIVDPPDLVYRRIFEGDYTTGMHLYWPTTNAIALSTDVAGVYSPLGSVYLAEKTTPGADTATRGQLWVRNDNPQTLMFTDGDSTDFTVAGALSGAVSATGTPLNNEIAVFVDGINNEIAVFVDGTTIDSDSTFTWDGSTLASTGTIALAGGSVSAAAYSFASDSNTGVYSDGAGLVGITADSQFAIKWVETGGQIAYDVHTAGGASANANQSQGDTPIERSYTIFTVVATEGDAVTLPAVFALGRVVHFKNDHATNGMQIFPALGDTITGEAVNVPITLAADSWITFIGTSANSVWGTLSRGIGVPILRNATVQTTTAAVEEIISVAIASGDAQGFEIHCVGTEDATGDTVFERIFGAIRNQGGTTALVGSTIIDRTDDAGATTWVISVEADDAGDALTVDVTGEGSHTIDWKVRVEMLLA